MAFSWKIETKLKQFITQRVKNPKLLEFMDNAYRFFFYPLDYLKYKIYLLTGKVYFGVVLSASQGNPYRHAYMSKVVQMQSAQKKELRLLEIGSWAGGSAIVWAEGIKRFNDGNGMLVCVDPWRCYFDLSKEKRFFYKEMERAMRKEKLLRLFFHNIRCAGVEDLIVPMRGFSGTCLPMLKDCQFDIIFIDGDHIYQSVLKDLKNSDRLLTDGGILCGDDLELQAREVDEDDFKKYMDRDCVMDTRTKTYFHPGVTLAVRDFFEQEVSSFDGFWAMKKNGNQYEKISL